MAGLLAGNAGLQSALERSLASSLPKPLHEALRENFAGSIIPAFERATQVGLIACRAASPQVSQTCGSAVLGEPHEALVSLQAGEQGIMHAQSQQQSSRSGFMVVLINTVLSKAWNVDCACLLQDYTA